MSNFSWARAIAAYYIIWCVFGVVFILKSGKKDDDAPSCTRAEIADPKIPRCEIYRTHRV